MGKFFQNVDYRKESECFCRPEQRGGKKRLPTLTNSSVIPLCAPVPPGWYLPVAFPPWYIPLAVKWPDCEVDH
jgi:hypothetical protein